MPKIDIAKLPIDERTNYPEPFNRVVMGRSRKRLGIAADQPHRIKYRKLTK